MVWHLVKRRDNFAFIFTSVPHPRPPSNYYPDYERLVLWTAVPGDLCVSSLLSMLRRQKDINKLKILF